MWEKKSTWNLSFYDSSSTILFHFFFLASVRVLCSSSSLHPAFFSSQIAQHRWCSSSSLHPVFFSSQTAYPASLRSFFRSFVGSSLLLRSSFFFGFFLFFLGSFFFFWVFTFFVLCLKSSVKNLRFIFFKLDS